MFKGSRIKARASLALMTLFVIAGCSSLPTAPQPGSPPDQAFAPSGVATGPASATPAPVQSATSTKTINGRLGGRVAAGNFTVVIPPLAIAGTATVTVSQPDVAKPFVELNISPASANRFRVPVTLIADATPMDSRLLSLAYISWYNPATRTWVRVPSSVVILGSRTVQAPLWHFSTYSVEAGGKAGW